MIVLILQRPQGLTSTPIEDKITQILSSRWYVVSHGPDTGSKSFTVNCLLQALVLGKVHLIWQGGMKVLNGGGGGLRKVLDTRKEGAEKKLLG